MLTRALTRMRSAQHETLAAALHRIQAANLHQQVHAPVSKRKAAVLIPLFEDEDGVLRVILCQRTSTLSTHAGEVALPGGKRDEGDRDDTHTALREAEEEIGLTDVEVLGSLKPVLSKHHLSVTPVLGRIAWPTSFKLSAAEVESVFDVPLDMFLSNDPAVHSYRDSDKSFGKGISYRLHFFQYKGYTIWGLTAGILIEAARVALGREPDFQIMPGQRSYTEIVFDEDSHTVLWRPDDEVPQGL